MLSLALGADSFKLKFGHRGGNQPIQDLRTSKVEIASHNHGFCIDANSIEKNLEITHLNLNDNTVAGIKHKHQPLFVFNIIQKQHRDLEIPIISLKNSLI